jgi:leader peptidase (prepilin peptidase)/N-methyltransferase
MELEIDLLVYLYIFLLGLFFGSFFNVVGIRIPNKQSLNGRSHCPNCNKTLGVLELFPIVGYIVLGGRCKDCKIRIPIKYPLMELLTGILFLVSFVFLRENMVEYILIVVFISLMVIITVSDLYYQVIPDIILIVFFPVILTLRLLSPISAWYDGMLGGILGFGFMYLIALYGRVRFKQDALGGGDIKLYLIIGVVLGYQMVILSLFFAALFGMLYSMIVRKKDGYLPFVPFIFAGSMLTYFVGSGIIEWYVSILN